MYRVLILVIGLLFLFVNAKAQVTFKTPPVISIPSTPQELAKGDFNNDGKTDFISAHFNALANQQITVLLNTGTGTFTGTNKKNFSSATNAIDIAVGDFNKDGKLDAVTCSQSNNNFSLLLGDGAGNLAAPVHFAGGDNPQGIAVGDMNKDGNADVLVSNRGTPDDVYIYFGNGAGGFSAPTIITIANIWDIAVADFNGDANPDFAVVVNGSPATVQFRFGNGSGTAYTTGPTVSGFATTEDLIAVNLDNDSDIDIVAGGGYSLNDGTGSFGARVVIAQTSYEYTVADLNNDTHPDIIANDNNQNTTNARIYLGDGVGNFTLLAKFETNTFFAGVEAADVNNDGIVDIIGVGGWGGIYMADILLGDGTGYFSNTITKYPTITDPRDMAKGDFNEDGKIDIALCHSIGNIISIYLGQGDGKFTKTATNYATGNFPSQILAFDYNQDGHTDLVTFNQSSSNLTIFTGAGNGTFNTLASVAVTGLAGSRMTIADFNNDTRPDIAVSGYTNNSVNLLTGTGSGFNTPTTISVSSTISEIKAGDFNGDGNQDIIASLNNISRMVLLTGNGTGGFTESTTQYVSTGSFYLVDDINNDSKPDVINFTTGSGNNDYFINDGTGTFTGFQVNSSLGGFPWGYADMNGDGFKDLILGAQNSSSSEPGQVLIFSGTASGVSNTILIDKDYSGGNRLVVHDVNADGKQDIITTSFNLYEDYLGTLINTTVPVGCPSITTQPVTQTVCEGKSVTLSVSATGNSPLTYQWRKGALNISGANAATYSINNITLSDAAAYSCVVSNACGSVISSVAVVTVSAAPAAPGAVGDSRCNPGAVTLNATGGSNGQYRWYTVSSGGTAIAGQTNSSYAISSLTATTTFYVAINNGTCESLRTSVTATMTGTCAQPPSISAQNLLTQIGGIVSLDLKPLISTSGGTLDISSIQITSNPSSGAVANISNGVLTINYSGILFSGTEQITIRACDTNGNCSTQQFDIEVAGDIAIYNALSPGGSNPSFIIQYVELMPETLNNTVTIFDRWQNQVWKENNYNNSSVVFKGVSSSGADLPTGIYFYRIDFANGRKSRTGFISLRR